MSATGAYATVALGTRVDELAGSSVREPAPSGSFPGTGTS